MDSSKAQEDAVPGPDALAGDVIISPDTRRTQRLPPGQSRTKKWPILDAAGPPRIDLASWTFRAGGLVGQPIEWNWQQFNDLPKVKVFSDFHCVTRWSRLGNLWEGVPVRALLSLAGGARAEARYVSIHAYDHGWTTNVPLEDCLTDDALVALSHDGEPLSAEHGGPARLVIPRLYAWKSAKWVAGIELLEQDRPGFWERNGYHNHGDPWREERYGW